VGGHEGEPLEVLVFCPDCAARGFRRRARILVAKEKVGGRSRCGGTGAEVGELADPLFVGAGRAEVALEQVAGPLERGLVRDRRPPLAAAEPASAPMRSHDAGDLVAASLDAAPAQLEPGLASAVHLPVTRAGGFDLHQQLTVAQLAGGRFSGPARRVRAHRHAHCAADRLDPEAVPPLLHLAGHRRRLGSSSVAK
jgi:hypothetical protein